MKTIARCARCGAEDAPPIEQWIGFTGALKERVQAEVCSSCWAQWLETQLMAINEYRLNLGKPEHRQVLSDLATQYFFSAEVGIPAASTSEGTPSLDHLGAQWSPEGE